MAKAPRKIRVLDRIIRDEDGVNWECPSPPLPRAEAVVARRSVERVIVHDEAGREARSPQEGEVDSLIGQLAEDGRIGLVIARTYRAGSRRLMVVTITDLGY